jgi:hypothetical protein
MKAKRLWAAGAFVLLALGGERWSSTYAQAGSTYDLTRSVIAGGGAMAATGGAYTLAATIGQSEAGSLSGGPYTLAGGFWGGANTGGALYLPLVVR